MSTLSVRLPNSLHRHLRELAEREGVSMNQLISSAVGEKLASLMTEDHSARASRGSPFQIPPIGCMRVFITPSCSSVVIRFSRCVVLNSAPSGRAPHQDRQT